MPRTDVSIIGDTVTNPRSMSTPSESSPRSLVLAARPTAISTWSGRIHSLPWRMVDLPGNVLRLDPAFSKTKKGRILPIPPPLRTVLDRRLAKRRLDCPLVFHVNRLAMGDWRKTWVRACSAAGLFRIINLDEVLQKMKESGGTH